jgi:hypothetical protein
MFTADVGELATAMTPAQRPGHLGTQQHAAGRAGCHREYARNHATDRTRSPTTACHSTILSKIKTQDQQPVMVLGLRVRNGLVWPSRENSTRTELMVAKHIPVEGSELR